MFSYTKEEYERKFKNPDYPAKQIAPFMDFFDYKGNKISEEEYDKNEEDIKRIRAELIMQNKEVVRLAYCDKIISSTDDLLKDYNTERIIERYSRMFDKAVLKEIKRIESHRGKTVNKSRIPYDLLELKRNLDDIINHSDEELEEILLKCIADFRMMNQDKFEFTYECPICFETSTNASFLINMCSCKHKCCLNCWKDHCMSVISNTHDELHCFECQEVIPHNRIVEHDLVPYDKLNKYYLIQYGKRNKDLVHCNHCQGIYINSSKRDDCRCPFCHYLMCTLCCEAGHHQQDCNMNCQEFEQFMKTPRYVDFSLQRENHRLDLVWKESAEYRKREEEERLRKEALEKKRREEEERQRLILQQEKQTIEWIRLHTKACPNCHSRIEKNMGCNHMKCLKCKHEFCWYCFKEVIGNDGAHYHFNIEGCSAGKKWFDDGYRED